MLRKASKRDETYKDGRDSTMESVKCTTTSCTELVSSCKLRVEGEYSIPKFLKTKEDIS